MCDVCIYIWSICIIINELIKNVYSVVKLSPSIAVIIIVIIIHLKLGYMGFAMAGNSSTIAIQLLLTRRMDGVGMGEFYIAASPSLKSGQ